MSQDCTYSAAVMGYTKKNILEELQMHERLVELIEGVR